MKQIIFILSIFLLTSCSTIVYDTQIEATVVDVKYNYVHPSKGQYIMIARTYYPKYRRYTIYSNEIYEVGSKFIIKGRK